MRFTSAGGGWLDGRTGGRTDRKTDAQLAGMKAIKQCTCIRRLLTSMKVQIGINLMVNNQIDR